MPATARSCLSGQVTDCNGSCTNPNFEGDGGCDDGSLFIDDLFCPYFSWDGGDCGPVDTGIVPIDTADTDTGVFDSADSADSAAIPCGPGYTTDCSGAPCAAGQVTDCNGSCTSPNFEGDGGCDDGSTFIDDLFCPYFSWDGGDCGPVDTGAPDDTADTATTDTDLLDSADTAATGDTAPIPCGPGYTIDCSGLPCATGQVTDCNGSCTSPNFEGDGGCDDGSTFIDDLFCPYFSWDGGDCGPVDTGVPDDTADTATADTDLLDTADTSATGDTAPIPCGPGYTINCSGLPCATGQVTDCNGSCTSPNFEGDGGCDDGSTFIDDLFCPYFNWDGGDCGPVDTGLTADSADSGLLDTDQLDSGDTAPPPTGDTSLTATGNTGDTGPIPCGPGYTIDCSGAPCATGQVTDCNGSCTSPNFEGDGGCDDGSLFIDDLFCAYFSWDGGDCGPIDTGITYDSSDSGFLDTDLSDTGDTTTFSTGDTGVTETGLTDTGNTDDTAPTPCGPGNTVNCAGVACNAGQVTDCNGSCTSPNFEGDGGCDDGSTFIDDLFVLTLIGTVAIAGPLIQASPQTRRIQVSSILTCWIQGTAPHSQPVIRALFQLETRPIPPLYRAGPATQ